MPNNLLSDKASTVGALLEKVIYQSLYQSYTGECEITEGSNSSQLCPALLTHCPRQPILSCSTIKFPSCPYSFQTSNHPPPLSTDNPHPTSQKIEANIWKVSISYYQPFKLPTCPPISRQPNLYTLEPSSLAFLGNFSSPLSFILSSARPFYWLLNRLKFPVKTRINRPTTSSSILYLFSSIASCPLSLPPPLRTKF